MIHVWIVEDHADFRNTVRQEIDESDGLHCDRAFGNCEALLKELDSGAAPDVLLLDIQLPGLSGIDAISAVKARTPVTEIIMLTSFDDQDTIFRALCAGASGYMLKTSMENIAQSVHEVLEGGAPLSTPIARSVLGLFNRLGPVQSEYHLTPREKSILELMVQGLIKKQIADRLQLSYHTVDGYLRTIYRKLHVNNAPGAVARAIRERLC